MRPESEGAIVCLTMIILSFIIMLVAFNICMEILYFLILLASTNALIIVPSHVVVWYRVDQKSHQKKKRLLPLLLVIVLVFDIVFIYGKIYVY